MSFDGKDTEGNEFGGINIHVDVNSGQTSVITYGNVRSIFGLGTTVLEINYAVLSFKFPTWDRFISQGPGTIKYSIEGPCDCVFVRFDQHARKIYFDKCK